MFMKFSQFVREIMLPSGAEYRIIFKIRRIVGGGDAGPVRQEGRDPGFEDGFEFFQEEIPFMATVRVSDLIDIAILAF